MKKTLKPLGVRKTRTMFRIWDKEWSAKQGWAWGGGVITSLGGGSCLSKYSIHHTPIKANPNVRKWGRGPAPKIGKRGDA